MVPGTKTAPHRIRALREAQGKTPQQVASDAGISPAAYQRAEGGGPVWRRTVGKIARALLVEPEELLEVYEGEPEDPGAPKGEGSEAAANIAAHRIRELRHSQLKSQQQVASDAGVVLDTYQRAERGDYVGLRTVGKIARALRVEPEELLELYEGRLHGAGLAKHWRPTPVNLRVLQASKKKTKRRVIALARVYGLYAEAPTDSPGHELFLERSDEAFGVLSAAGFSSLKISAAHDFVFEAGSAGLRALLGDEQGRADPRLVRAYADTLFELAQRGEIDLPTALGCVGLVRVAFAL